MPVPSATRTEGVVWLPERARVQPGVDGVVKRLLAEPFTAVRAGQPLIALEDVLLDARVKVLESELQELRTQHRIERLTDPVEAAQREEAIAAKRAELDRELERADQLVVTSASDGLFVLRRASDLEGRLLRQGEPVGYVMDDSAMTLRVVVPQDRIGLVRERLLGVEVRLADALSETISATVTRDVPAAGDELPSKVLGTAGGGRIPVDPGDERGVASAESVFQLEVRLDERPEVWRVGQRAHVRFDHGSQPLAEQWLRLGRQLFLRRFGV